MRLTKEEEAMLQGGRGEAVQEAIRLQMEVGRFWDAECFVPVSNVHMMGDIEVLGDAGKDFLQRVAAKGALAVCSTSTNARCIDFAYAERLRQDPDSVGKETQVIRFLKDMNISTVDTCINYQTIYQPHFGEHVAWGDTGAVIYANSVFGARSNFEGGPSALAAAITGRTPAYGFHLDEHRKGTFQVHLKFEPMDYADWGAIGKLVGEKNLNYFAVPVFEGLDLCPTSDELKHLGASLASYGSMGMFHMVGVTPEARTAREAFDGRAPNHSMTITQDDVKDVYAHFSNTNDPLNLIVFSAPQLSLYEIKRLSEMFRGRRIRPDTQVFITTSNGVKSQAQRLGYLQGLEHAGAMVLEGVCFYILQNLPQMRDANGWRNIVTNSAKLANIIGAHKFNPVLQRTQSCVDIAVNGKG